MCDITAVLILHMSPVLTVCATLVVYVYVAMLVSVLAIVMILACVATVLEWIEEIIFKENA